MNRIFSFVVDVCFFNSRIYLGKGCTECFTFVINPDLARQIRILFLQTIILNMASIPPLFIVSCFNLSMGKYYKISTFLGVGVAGSSDDALIIQS